MKIVTHAGYFHADEAFAVLVLSNLFPYAEIVRTYDFAPHKESSDFLLDIGREYEPMKWNYDHHQGSFKDEDGYEMATAGLVWKDYGGDFVNHVLGPTSFTSIIAKHIGKTFVRALDAYDADGSFSETLSCGAGELHQMSLMMSVRRMNGPDVKDDKDQRYRFYRAMDLLRSALVSSIRAAFDYEIAMADWDVSYKLHLGGKLLVLSKGMPWKRKVHEEYPGVQMVAVPSPRKEAPWSLQMVPDTPTSRTFRNNHPGIEDKPGLNTHFIHNSKFIAGCVSFDAMMKLAKHNLVK